MTGSGPGITAAVDVWVNARLAKFAQEPLNDLLGAPVAGAIIFADASPAWVQLAIATQDDVLRINAGVPAWTSSMALASLTNPTRGDVMIGNSTPNWSGLGIGAADRVFVSDGTDPSWATAIPLAAVPAHNLLSTQHGDTAASTRTRGDLIIATASAWDDLAIGSSGDLLRSDGTDIAWSSTIPTPGTLTVSTSNSGTAPHTHGITSSSNPGGAAAILATASDGGSQLLRLGIGIDPSVDNAIMMVDNAFIGLGSAAGRIEFDNQATDEINVLDAFFGINVTNPGVRLHVRDESSATSTAPTTQIHAHITTGTAADGFGQRILYKLETSTGGAQSAAFFDTVWSTAANATRKAYLRLGAFDAAGGREGLRISTDGSVAAISFYGDTVQTRQTISSARDNPEGALADLLTALDNLGLLTDSSTAS